MITEIEIEGFKSLEKVHLKLGKLNLFVGANASGKSNFLEALRVLQGIGYGFKINEVLNGKPKSATSEVWEGIRGGSRYATFSARSKPGLEAEREIKLSTVLKVGDSQHQYSVSIFKNGIRSEALDREERTVPSTLAFSFLGQIPQSPLFQVHEKVKRALSNMQKIDFDMATLRAYSQDSVAQRIGERGENFAALISKILMEERLKKAYLSWLSQLTPMELEDVTVLPGALGEPLFALKEGDNVLPAPILSDGTLRFAAITAAFFQMDMPDIIKIEEIENGIHPSRLRLLVELLKSQSGGTGPQVFATTHSPVVLAWLEESDYKTTFFCRRDEETGASIIKPLSEIPRLVELVKNQSLGELFTEGWMEAAF
ncbi:MAG TPA: AAA family ATPase [Thermoanaerobaculia bacterium]|nr:AAA family ATPase [Thermoanaerobaculia bacterium]